MDLLVVGGTGTVGSTLVRALRGRGVGGIRVLTRSPEKAAALPPGVRGVVADLGDPLALEGAFDGVKRLFLLTAVSRTELHEALAALEGARRAGVEKVVHLSVPHPEKGAHVPHFATKLVVEGVLRESGVNHVILRPGHYYQNDFWLKDALLEHGVYPQPLGPVGIARVDVRDVAKVAADALLESRLDGQVVPVVGTPRATGAEGARCWTRILGRPIRHAGDDVFQWEAGSRASLPAWLAWDLRVMYALFQDGSFAATEEEMAASRAALGVEPRSFESFAREAAAFWGAGPAEA